MWKVRCITTTLEYGSSGRITRRYTALGYSDYTYEDGTNWLIRETWRAAVSGSVFDWVRYRYANGKPNYVEIAQSPSDLSNVTSYDQRYLQADWHGDIVARVATDGSGGGWARYGAWGEMYSVDIDYAWNGAWGYLWFNDLGLYYVHGRWYNHDTGLFLSPDQNGSYIYFDNDGINKPYGLYARPPSQVEASDPLVFYDLTDWLIREMSENILSPIGDRISFEMRVCRLGGPSCPIPYIDWFDMVQTHGLWDFKWAIDRKLGQSIRLVGTWYRYDVPGNIHYAYLGRALGFSESELICGGAFAAIKGHPDRITMLCEADDPEDREAIAAGFDLWNTGGILTQAKLKSVLRRHPGIANAAGIPERAYPDRPLNVLLSWPYPVGYFDDGSAGWFTRSR